MAKGREVIREIAVKLMNLPPGADDAVRHEALRQLARAASRRWRRRSRSCTTSSACRRRRAQRTVRGDGQRGAPARTRQRPWCGCSRRRPPSAPVLLVIEDLHWADKVTLDHVAALTRAVGTLPVVLALTSRVAGDPLTAAWRASVQGSPLLTIDLGSARRQGRARVRGRIPVGVVGVCAGSVSSARAATRCSSSSCCGPPTRATTRCRRRSPASCSRGWTGCRSATARRCGRPRSSASAFRSHSCAISRKCPTIRATR